MPGRSATLHRSSRPDRQAYRTMCVAEPVSPLQSLLFTVFADVGRRARSPCCVVQTNNGRHVENGKAHTRLSFSDITETHAVADETQAMLNIGAFDEQRAEWDAFVQIWNDWTTERNAMQPNSAALSAPGCPVLHIDGARHT